MASGGAAAYAADADKLWITTWGHCSPVCPGGLRRCGRSVTTNCSTGGLSGRVGQPAAIRSFMPSHAAPQTWEISTGSGRTSLDMSSQSRTQRRPAVTMPLSNGALHTRSRGRFDAITLSRQSVLGIGQILKSTTSGLGGAGQPARVDTSLCRGRPHHGTCLGQDGEPLLLSMIYTLLASAANATTPHRSDWEVYVR